MSDAFEAYQRLVEELTALNAAEYEANSEFNQYYDDQFEMVALGELQFLPSKVLFCLDRDSYEEARKQWEIEIVQDRHNEVVRVIREQGQLDCISALAEAVRRKRIVPFVGAGLSKPMGIPLWGEALRKLNGEVLNLNDPRVYGMIDEGRYLEAAEILAARNLVMIQNFIKRTFKVHRVLGPVSVLPKIAAGCLVTTNFDDGIEESFKLEKIHFDAYMHGTQQHNFFSRLVRGQQCLLKLHGDADDPQTYILTKTQYLEAYKDPFDFRLPLPKALRQIYISTSMLFLGCSLEQDWTLELFKSVRDQNEYEPPTHYAILPLPSVTTEKQRKESALLAVSIQPIWYPVDEHQHVEKILQLVLDVAENRIKLS